VTDIDTVYIFVNTSEARVKNKGPSEKHLVKHVKGFLGSSDLYVRESGVQLMNGRVAATKKYQGTSPEPTPHF
jgi:hypothetical protein